MLRLDSGPGAGRGDFQCSVAGCSWSKRGIDRKAAYRHIQRHHPGVTVSVQRAIPKRLLSDEEKKERNAAWCRRYRQDIKAVSGIGTPRGDMGELEHDAGGALNLLSGLDAKRPQGSLCVSSKGSVGVFASVVPGGRGLRSITGSADPHFLDAAQVAITWASLHVGWLRARGAAIVGGRPTQRKGPFSRSGLQSPVEDAVVSFVKPYALEKKGQLAGACVALAAVQWLWRPLTTRGVVSVTGPLTLRGLLEPAADIKEKAAQAHRRKASMLITSGFTYDKAARDDFASWPEDLRPFARSSLRRADSMVEVLEHAFQGFKVTPSMEQALLDSALVGWAVACGLEGLGVVHVECCHVRPGSMGGLILTGGLCEGLRQVVRQTVDIVRGMVEPLAAQFGVADSKRLSLHKAGHDLHIHVTNYQGGQVPYGSYMAAVAVALVGLMVGRRPSDPRTAVLGEVTPDWVLVWSPELQWGSADVAGCRAQGIRRLLVPDGIRMDAAAWAAARALEDDGQPCVDVVCVPRSERIFPMLRAVLDRKVQGWSLWDSDAEM